MNETKNVEQVGVPTLAFLPAKNFRFTVSDNIYTFTLPIKGKYVDLDSEFFSEEEGEFVIYEDGVLQVPIITRVLFATSKYPKLDDNQLFCPLNFKLEEENIVIFGQIITMGENNV